jgi:hypothetical protein
MLILFIYIWSTLKPLTLTKVLYTTYFGTKGVVVIYTTSNCVVFPFLFLEIIKAGMWSSASLTQRLDVTVVTQHPVPLF